MKEKHIKKDEFRRYKNEYHPKYVYERVGDTFTYLSMTHTPPQNDSKNYEPLIHSANPKDKKTAYIRTKAEKDHMKNFGARKKGWYFIEKDKKLVERIIKQNKKGKR